MVHVQVKNLNYERAQIDVTRKGPFGNPFTHLSQGSFGIRVKDRDEAVDRFIEYFYSERGRSFRQRCLLEIPAGATIGCVCAPKRCHADVIAGYVNWKKSFEHNTAPKARTVIYDTTNK